MAEGFSNVGSGKAHLPNSFVKPTELPGCYSSRCGRTVPMKHLAFLALLVIAVCADGLAQCVYDQATEPLGGPTIREGLGIGETDLHAPTHI